MRSCALSASLMPRYSSLSNRLGRRSAGSSRSDLFVVPITKTSPGLLLRSKGLKVRRAQVVLRRKWSQGTGTLNDVGSALRSLPKTNVLG